MTLTQEQISALVKIRNQMTNRRDEQIDHIAVDLLDDVLRDVPPGQRNDVDLLLGRMCAQLPNRADYNPLGGVDWTSIKAELNAERAAMIERDMQAAAHEAGVTAEHLTPREVAMLEARTDEQSGIVDHDDWNQGAWK